MKIAIFQWGGSCVNAEEEINKFLAKPGRKVVNTIQSSASVVGFEDDKQGIGTCLTVWYENDPAKAEDLPLSRRPVGSLDLSARADSALRNANITTLGQLCGKTNHELLKYRNFGKKSLREVKEKLAGLGLGLGMRVD